MLTESSETNAPDISGLRALIRRTRAFLRSTWVVTGACVVVGLFLTALVVVSLTDLALPLWPAFRFTALMIVLVPAAWALFMGVIRPLFRKLTEALVARRIEREIPNIHNRLVSCVDLSMNGHAEHSPAFYQRLVTEAKERVTGFDLKKVLDLLSLRRAGIFASAGVIAMVLAMTLFSGRLPTAIARIFRPFDDIPPASGVLYDVLLDEQATPGDHETLRGEDVAFNVLLRKGEIQPIDPLRLEVYTTNDDGAPKTLRYDFAELQEDRTAFTLTGLQETFTYRVFGGGTWSKQRTVTMLDRPRIVNLQTALHYPEYMRISEPRLGAPQTVDVTGPMESTVEIKLDVDGDAFEGEIELLQMQTKTIDVLNRPERVWVSDAMPQGAAADGTWEWDEETIGDNGHSDAAADAAHGHGFHSAPVGFEVRVGEVLFADVYLLEDQMPQSIMLKWHDGQNWEHRAFWGENKIEEGTLDTESRLPMGDLPTAGKLVRLEVPAAAVGLEGKRLHGISFTLFGGKAVWGSAGTMPAAQKQVTALAATESVLLNRDDSETTDSPSQQWTGKFKLQRSGFYRVVLRNKIGYPNQKMREGKLTAIRDNPPQVVIERPGKALLVSEPVKVPIYISAYDDFGLTDVVISVQKGEESGFQGRPVREFERPQRTATNVVTLDLAEEKLQVGETLTYRVEVRDGRGQSATTLDHTIRMADDNNAADRQLAQHQEKTETFEEKLVELIAQQKKVQEQVEQVAEKFKPLTEKVEQAKVEAAKAAEKAKEANPDQPVEEQPLELDDEAKAQLAELQKELAPIMQAEDQSIQLGQQVAAELNQLAEHAPTLEMLPPELAQQLQSMSEAFNDVAVTPMQQLRELMNQSAQPQQLDPQVPEMERQSDALQENLEDIQGRIEAIADAQRKSRTDVESALADLRDDMMQQDAKLTARDLAELREFIEAMREDLDVLKGTQEDLLADSAQDLSERLFDSLVEEQDELDTESDEALAEARDLLDMEELRRLRAERPDFPARPFDPERDEYLIPPAEQDTEEAEGEDGDENAEGEEGEDGEEGMEDEEPPLFLPALDGPLPKLDPRFRDKMRELKKKRNKNEDGEGEDDPRRDELRSRQMQRLEELAAADQALASDEQTLDELLENLESQLPADALAQMSQDQLDQLRQMLSSKNLQQAQAMMQRMREMMQQNQDPNQPQEAQQAQLPTPSELNPLGNMEGVIGGVDEILVELDDFDLAARTVIMRMQPKAREELLQGLREEGPEGYREFIRDYFRRLTEVQGASGGN